MLLWQRIAGKVFQKYTGDKYDMGHLRYVAEGGNVRCNVLSIAA